MYAPQMQTPGWSPANAETKEQTAQIIGDDIRADKPFLDMRAQCALAEVALVKSTDDQDRPVFIVSRWALCKQLDSLEAVANWLSRVTGKPIQVRHG